MNIPSFKKFMENWKWTLILLFICILGIPVCTVLGIQSVNWGNDFWPNALSEFLGMFVELIFGAIFTFVVIDKYMQYNKNKQWRKIKNITYKSLYFSLSNIAIKLNYSLPLEFRVNDFVLSEDIETLNDYLPKEDFDVFITLVEKNLQKLTQEKFPAHKGKVDESLSIHDENLYSFFVKFKKNIKNDINTINSSILPKMLGYLDDVVLLDEIIELVEFSTSLMAKIHDIHKVNHKNSEVKLMWLLATEGILGKLKLISDVIESDIDSGSIR